MNAPRPYAPPDYEEPIWRHDDLDVLVIVDRESDEFPPLTADEEISHPMDRFVVALSNELHSLLNVSNLVRTTKEVRYMEDLPTGIYAVVTNSEPYADWCKSWGGRLVELTVKDEVLFVTSMGESVAWDPAEREGMEFATEAIQRPFEQPLQGGQEAFARSRQEDSVSEMVGAAERVECALCQVVEHDRLEGLLAEAIRQLDKQDDALTQKDGLIADLARERVAVLAELLPVLRAQIAAAKPVIAAGSPPALERSTRRTFLGTCVSIGATLAGTKLIADQTAARQIRESSADADRIVAAIRTEGDEMATLRDTVRSQGQTIEQLVESLTRAQTALEELCQADSLSMVPMVGDVAS